MAILVQIFRASVIAIVMLPALRTLNGVIAILAPAIEIVGRGRVCSLILRIVGALNGYELAGINARAALRLGNFCLTIAHGDFGLRVIVDLNAIFAGAKRMHSGIRRVNFRISAAVRKDAIANSTLPDLKLNVVRSKVRDFHCGIPVQADNVRVIELNLRARIVTGGNAVAGFQRSIHRGCDPVAGISALNRYVAADDADAPNGWLRLRGALVISGSSACLNVCAALLLRPQRPVEKRTEQGHRKKRGCRESQMFFHRFTLRRNAGRAKPELPADYKAWTVPNTTMEADTCTSLFTLRLQKYGHLARR